MHRAPQLVRLALRKQTAAPSNSTGRRIRTIILSTALIATVCAVSAPKTSAQDLGEIARQERAKKQNNPAPPATHVYTNEDMHRQQILTPEDQSRFSATTQPATVAPSKPASQLASELTPPGNAYSFPSCGSCGMNLPIGASPRTLIVSTAPNKISPASQTNISTTSTTRAKTNPAPATPSTTHTNISVSSATSAKFILAQPTQPAAKIISAAAAQPATQIPIAQVVAQIPSTQILDALIPTTVPLDQMPLGDIARYYRGIKHQSARANAQLDPGPANAPSAPASATTIPNAIPLNQMPLGDVARYYRAKQREESQAQVQEVATIQTKPPTTPVRAITPVSKYPLTLATMPLASPKRIPTRAPEPISARIAPSTTSRRLVAPKRSTGRLVAPKPSGGGSVGGSAAGISTLIRITSGDTLWQLARKYLGSAARWPELLSLNPSIQNPKRLQVGTQLILHPSTV